MEGHGQEQGVGGQKRRGEMKEMGKGMTRAKGRGWERDISIRRCRSKVETGAKEEQEQRRNRSKEGTGAK